MPGAIGSPFKNLFHDHWTARTCSSVSGPETKTWSARPRLLANLTALGNGVNTNQLGLLPAP